MAILLDAQQLTASFGARPLFEGVSFTVDAQERIGLIGPNGAGEATVLAIPAVDARERIALMGPTGAGKSPLLRILAEAASPDGGSIARRRGLRVALLDQT